MNWAVTGRRFAAATVVGCALAGPAFAYGDQTTVVARGLDNPRGLAFGPKGDLFVSEAGRGGTDQCALNPEGRITCFGKSGAITRVDVRHGGQKRFVSGLPSIANPDGSTALGASDVSFDLLGIGYISVGLGRDPSLRPQLPPAAATMAGVTRVLPNGHTDHVADLGAFELAHNPDAGMPTAVLDSNPNSVISLGLAAVVSDAAANAILGVGPFGHVSLLSVIPFQTVPGPGGAPTTSQSVPTSIVFGPDAALYVGQLTGFPFPVGGASVWRVVPGRAPSVFASGFTQITDIAFGPDRSLYVLEYAVGSIAGAPTPGALIRVGRDGRRTTITSTLTAPTGLAIADGYAYVSNRGSSAGTGEVLRIKLPN